MNAIPLASVTSLPIEVVYGLYLGLLTGIVPMFIAWALGFGFRYLTGVTIPGLAVTGLGVAVAGAQGGILALADPAVTDSAMQVRLTVALLVVLAGTLYTHSIGDKMGAALPKRVTLRELRQRTLSAEVVDLVGGRGTVRIEIAGEIGDVEGYPPAPASLRDAIRDGEWDREFPADVPLPELERRVESRLRSRFELQAVEVRLDERARATVGVAPPVAGLSARVGSGRRAVTVRAPAPSDLAVGDEVRVDVRVPDADTASSKGASASTRTAGSADGTSATSGGPPPDDGGHDAAATADASSPSPPSSAPKTPAEPDDTASETGPAAQIEGTVVGVPAVTETSPTPDRIAVSVASSDAPTVLNGPVDRLVILSRGTRLEFELVSLLRRAGGRFKRLAVGSGGPLADGTLGDAAVRDEFAVAVLAVHHDDQWVFAPRGGQPVAAGDELYAVGTRTALARFEEAVA
jgi:hypothetical protein